MRTFRAASGGGVLVLVLLAGSPARAQDKPLSIDVIYDAERRVNFGGVPPPEITWLDPGHYLTRGRAAAGREWQVVEAVTGVPRPLFDVAAFEAALAKHTRIGQARAASLARGALTFNPAYTAVVLTIDGDLYHYEFAGARLTRLTTRAGEEEEVSFSPDGQRVAFVRRNNLFTVDLASSKERALTTDGGRQVFNGKLDWLYQEEIYGRGNFRAYWWSPDSSRVAFLRLDESPVPEYTVVDHIPTRPELEITDYPKAGDPNPLVQIGIARAGGGVKWVDLDAYPEADRLIVNVSWAPDSRRLLFQLQNREQTWLELNAVDRDGGAPKVLVKETSQAWVNENGAPAWQPDGTFLWISERSGFRHVYHYRSDGSAIRPITSGRWDVRSLYGVAADGWMYFAATERSSIGTDVYRVRLDGSSLTRLSQPRGRHRASFSPDFSLYVGFWSNISTPTQARLHRSDGAEERVIETNPVPALGEYSLQPPEFVTVPARDGFPLEAMLIKPAGFDRSRRYPVYQFTYAGPGAQSVVDAWQGSDYLFYQLLAQQGVLVWVLDNRSATGKGVESQWPIYGRLGELELQDLEDGVDWLAKQPYVDTSRILLSGWSYGGFMTGYALTHSTRFAAGIVGAPVTDLRNYDTVYTERYMRTPQNNPDGYARSSVVRAAGALHGRALLLHGTIDDNVHMQNTIQLAYELQKAGKPFELMIYPRSRHGIVDPRQNKHLHQVMFDFVLRTIGAGAVAGGDGASVRSAR
jgi:dipeptidyl-peptidase 4